MPRLRLVVGMNVCGESREAGEVVDAPADVAQNLISLGRAELIRGDQPETPEGKPSAKEKAARSGSRKRQEVRNGVPDAR